MKIDDFDRQKKEVVIPFNVAEDLYVYMKNDPMFYRKSFFPAVASMSDRAQAGKSVNLRSTMTPVILKAAKSYCKKYKIPKEATELFRQEDINEILEKIKDDELELIRKGEY
jgi:hypothetical protein